MKTTVNGKEIKLFNRESIEEFYTKCVKNYLDVGYNFYFYSGSQGEEVKTCLTKDGGKTVYDIFVDKRCKCDKTVLTVCIKKFEDVYPNKILWLSEGEEVFKMEFYLISEIKDNEVYVDNVEDFETLKNISLERYRTTYDIKKMEKYVELPKSCYKTALKIIQKRKGYKSIQLKDIESIKRIIGYGYEFIFENRSKNFSIKSVK